MRKETEQDLDEALGIVMLVYGEIEEGSFWAYVEVFPSKYIEFVEIQKSGEPYILTDYGDVLKFGLNESEPPEEVVQYMIDEYGIDPDFQDKLKREVEHEIFYEQDES